MSSFTWIETIKTDIRRPSEGEFESLAYDVMACIFQVHNELGRLIAALRDWGTGLDLHLYESAISYIFGGEDAVLRDIEIIVDGVKIGEQKARLTSSGAIFKVTALHDSEHRFEQHARRFLNHTLQPALHWVNVTRNEVRLKTLIREEG